MIIKNITGSFIDLYGLITVDVQEISPIGSDTYTETGISAGATIDLLVYNTPARIFECFELWRQIVAGSIVVICNGIQLSAANSLIHFQTFGLQCALDYNNISISIGAEVYSENQGTGISLTVLSQFEIYDQFDTNGQSRLCTPDQANDRIQIDEDGIYLVNCSITAEGDAGELFQWEVHKNGFRNINLTGRASFVSETLQNISISGLLSCVAADLIDLRVRCYTTATATAKGRDVNLSVIRVFK